MLVALMRGLTWPFQVALLGLREDLEGDKCVAEWVPSWLAIKYCPFQYRSNSVTSADGVRVLRLTQDPGTPSQSLRSGLQLFGSEFGLASSTISAGLTFGPVPVKGTNALDY